MRPLRAVTPWASSADLTKVAEGMLATRVMAAKQRKISPAEKASVSAKLQAMVQDVERWPLSEQLLKVLDQLEDEDTVADDEVAGGDNT